MKNTEKFITNHNLLNGFKIRLNPFNNINIYCYDDDDLCDPFDDNDTVGVEY